MTLPMRSRTKIDLGGVCVDSGLTLCAVRGREGCVPGTQEHRCAGTHTLPAVLLGGVVVLPRGEPPAQPLCP